MKFITYLIYIVFWCSLTIGGSAYVVFCLDQSGLWFLLGIFMAGCAYSPDRWAKLGAKFDSLKD